MSNFKDMMIKNRKLILAILLVPVFGMAIAIPLIIWKAPANMTVVIGITILLIAQYSLLVLWINRKMNQLVKS
jgi:hypothetical protein